MAIGRFLAAIVALIWDPATGKYLILQRSAQKDVGAGNWECPTGRLDQGEGFEDALYREVWEELQVRPQIEFLLGTTHFHRGEAIPENELIGLVYGCTLPAPAAVQIGEEHAAMHWMSREEAFAFLPEAHWLRWCIHRAELIRGTIPAGLAEVYRTEGFEIDESRIFK